MEIEQQPTQTKKERKEQRRKEKEIQRERRMRARNVKKYALRGLVLAAIVVVGVGVWKISERSTITAELTVNEVLQVQDDDWKKGNPDADVVLYEYLDFECEACGAYYPLIKRLVEEYSDRVMFVTRYFPLPSHKNSMTAALAIEAAGRQGKYWEMHDLLFEEQQNWGERPAPEPVIFERYAEQLNLDMERFKQDVNSTEVKNRVVRDRNAGRQLNVTGTPTFFLNGEKIQNPRGYEAFVALLENALKQ